MLKVKKVGYDRYGCHPHAEASSTKGRQRRSIVPPSFGRVCVVPRACAKSVSARAGGQSRGGIIGRRGLVGP